MAARRGSALTCRCASYHIGAEGSSSGFLAVKHSLRAPRTPGARLVEGADEGRPALLELPRRPLWRLPDHGALGVVETEMRPVRVGAERHPVRPVLVLEGQVRRSVRAGAERHPALPVLVLEPQVEISISRNHFNGTKNLHSIFVS